MLGLWVGLLAAVVGQVPAIEGTLRDASGKPAAGCELLLSAGVDRDGRVPVISRGRTGEDGSYRLELPGQERLTELSSAATLWAIGRDGSFGIGMIWPIAAPELRLGPKWAERRPRVVRLTQGGRPIAGARVSPRVIQRWTNYTFAAIVPDELASRWEAVANADGEATLAMLGPEDTLIGLQISAEGRPTQTIDLAGDDRKAGRWPSPRGRSERIDVEWPTGRPIRARVVDKDGHPAKGLAVQVWNQLDIGNGPMRVIFQGGLTDADGRFETPEGTAFPCRLLIRADRSAPVLSDWLREGEEFQARLVPLRAIEGRVVDRAGRPIADVEVFQTGDGPARTATWSDQAGRFRLEGLGPGPALIFARAEGFRFQGKRIEGGDAEIELTRTSEPARPMPTVADRLSRDERKALARRLLGPYLKVVLPSEENNGKTWALRSLVKIDPGEALEVLDRTKSLGVASADLVRQEAAVAMVRDDPDEAAAVVEAIEERARRSSALLALADALPADDRQRRRDWLERAVVALPNPAEISNRLMIQGRLAERFWELGETDRARALFDEGRKLAEQVADPNDPGRAFFAFHLGRVDRDQARRWIEPMSDGLRKFRCLRNLAVRLPIDEAEAILDRLGPKEEWGARLRLCQQLATTDPDRAERLAGSAVSRIDRAGGLLLIARGVSKTDRPRAESLFRKALAELDQIADPGSIGRVAGLLPWAEAIAPECVPEVYWRAAALRGPSGDPQREDDPMNTNLPLMMARYDRSVAALMFGPWERWKGHRDASLPYVVETMMVIDPERAVEYVEALPPPKKPEDLDGPNWARTSLAEHLAQDAGHRWHRIWKLFSNSPANLDDSEIW